MYIAVVQGRNIEFNRETGTRETPESTKVREEGKNIQEMEEQPSNGSADLSARYLAVHRIFHNHSERICVVVLKIVLALRSLWLF